ncbi:MAG: hypothetical protein ACJ746_08570 [Bryobacteraceae bacterium]
MPQPLDSPASPRPVLYEFFSRLLRFYGTPESLPDAWSTACFWALFVPPALVLFAYLRRDEKIVLHGKFPGVLFFPRGLFFGSIAECLLLGRFPALSRDELNPDEGAFLFGAHKLFFDSNYFHSVGCHTSGPMNVYPLMLPALFGLSPDFASIRALGLLVIFFSAYFLYKAFALIASDDIARLAILPMVAAFCTLENTEFLHMSSEQIPLVLISMAIYLSVRVLKDPRAHRDALFLLGLTASAAVFTKIQNLPIVAVMATVAVACVHASGRADKMWKPILLVALGTVPLFLLNALLCLMRGVWNDFWIDYIVSNWTYAGGETTTLNRFLGLIMLPDEIRFLLFTALGVGAAFVFKRIRFRRTNEETGFGQMVVVAGITIGTAIFIRENLTESHIYLACFGIVAGMAYVVASFRGVWFLSDRIHWFGVLALAFIATGFFVNYAPHRPYLHYLLFLVQPLCAGMAWMLMRESGDSVGTPTHERTTASQGLPIRRGMALVSLFVTMIVGYESYVWTLTSSQPFGDTRTEPFKRIGPTIRPPEGDFIRALTTDDSRIRIWGWTVRPYLGSGRVGEGPDTHVVYCFRRDRFRGYYVRRFLSDMEQRPPDVFIDAVGPTSWFLNDPKLYNFEQFPRIAGFIKTNYVHLTDLYGQRFFLRRDLATRREALFNVPLAPKSCDHAALSCLASPTTLPKDLPPVNMPEHASLEAEFVPIKAQIGPATVFNNEAVPSNNLGFRFQHATGDRYVLRVGTGAGYVGSKEFTLPRREPVRVRIEFHGSTVQLECNDSHCDVLNLPRPFANSPGPINLNSWIGNADPFAGKMQFFQILDLEKQDQEPGPAVMGEKKASIFNGVKS